MSAMFCYQCQEAAKNEACTIRGVCGKTPEVAHLQDLLVWLLKGISFWGVRARNNLDIVDPETDLFVAQALFATITNANFDPDRYVAWIEEAVTRRDSLRARAQAKCGELHGSGACISNLSDYLAWTPKSYDAKILAMKGQLVGILADPDRRGGHPLPAPAAASMASRAWPPTPTTPTCSISATTTCWPFCRKALLATTDDTLGAGDLVGLVLKAGEMGVGAMALLDEANTTTYGHPEPTQVNLGVRPGPAILVSGHDLRDLDELLQQTEGKGVNVYTHGEMLPANAYPAFKKYDHFVGNYGGSWWHQRDEFDSFNGAILMTTNCIVPPKDSYMDRCSPPVRPAGPACTHIADREAGAAEGLSAP